MYIYNIRIHYWNGIALNTRHVTPLSQMHSYTRPRVRSAIVSRSLRASNHRHLTIPTHATPTSRQQYPAPHTPPQHTPPPPPPLSLQPPQQQKHDFKDCYARSVKLTIRGNYQSASMSAYVRGLTPDVYSSQTRDRVCIPSITSLNLLYLYIYIIYIIYIYIY